ncbi:MAG: hypothetical protein ACRDCN_15595 [Tannerellaceae bacterium]
MTTNELYALLKTPSLLNAKTLPELKELLTMFPYFQVVKMLYLKNLRLLNDPVFADELKRLAVGITDRRKLFMLIEGERFLQYPKLTQLTQNDREGFSLIEDFLTARNVPEAEALSLENEALAASVSNDYLFWSGDKAAERESSEVVDNKMQHQDLIDSFISTDETNFKFSFEEEEDESCVEVEHQEDVPESQEDDFFTETLARIYIKQKRYEKALEIIKKLSLKYPEKNVYFADQIHFLENLIINSKNKL